MPLVPCIEPFSARKEPLAAELALDEIAARLQTLYRLPPMPALAFWIPELTAKPGVTAKQPAEVVELDPSMAAQLLLIGHLFPAEYVRLSELRDVERPF